MLEQSRVSVAGRAGVLFWEARRRLSRPRPTASHVLLTEACMNYYISFCYLSSRFITDTQLSLKRKTVLRGPSRCPQRERERETDRESLHSPLKRTEEDGQKHIVRGFKKEAYGCHEKRTVLLKEEKNESAR